MKTSESFIPVYFKLADDIKHIILAGELKPGDALPTEAQLCSQYNISRMTARNGLKLLNEEGLIESSRGKGSFVARPKFNNLIIELPDTHINSLEEASCRLIGINIIKADDQIASILKLKPGSKIIKIRKLYAIGSDPIALDTIYRKGQPLVEQEIHYSAFPKVVARHTGLTSIRNQVTFSAVPFDNETAKLLCTEAGKPALQIEQLVYGIEEQPLGWSVTICNGEKYHLSACTKDFL